MQWLSVSSVVQLNLHSVDMIIIYYTEPAFLFHLNSAANIWMSEWASVLFFPVYWSRLWSRAVVSLCLPEVEHTHSHTVTWLSKSDNWAGEWAQTVGCVMQSATRKRCSCLPQANRYKGGRSKSKLLSRFQFAVSIALLSVLCFRLEAYTCQPLTGTIPERGTLLEAAAATSLCHSSFSHGLSSCVSQNC